MSSTTEQFYDSVSGEYTDFVERCVPRYKEMLSTLFDYLPENYSPKSILELGCGTGNLTLLIYRHFPESHIQAVDISEECLNECQQRLTEGTIKYIKADFKDIEFGENSFDLIMSSIALHHLDDREKEQFFQKLFLWQAPNGILTFCDQFRGETDRLYHQHLDTWKSFAFDQGATDEVWNTWMEHQTHHDHHASLPEHINWLKSAGYTTVDCTWRYLLWAALYAEKA
ncbi:MAG: class I SAM-dependent methyltransferase [Chloroflexota bacterium]|nr:class I SAM-dependent methyltransferase [Chloroflexota bacterium]